MHRLTSSRCPFERRDAGRVAKNGERGSAVRPASAFTLIELLVVVAILGLIIGIGIPFVRMAIDNGKGMSKAIKDIEEACSHARAIAILQQTTSELRIRPGDGTFEVGASATPAATVQFSSPDVDGHEWRMGSRSRGGDAPKGFSSRLPTGIIIEGLGVNGEDWTEDDQATVRFYSNGTCDSMSVVLRTDQGERRNIYLEVVTGLPDVESDPQKFRAR